MKYIDAEKLIERLEEMKQAEYENCGGVNSKTGALQEVQKLIESLQQEQPEVDLEKLGGIARHLIAVKDNEEDMRLDEVEWLLLERIGYPERFNARKEE